MSSTQAQQLSTPWLQQYLQNQSGTALQKVLAEPGLFRCQVLLIQIDRDAQNRPSLTRHYLHYDPAGYFNPASVVKMPIAFLALEKLNRTGRPDITHRTPIEFLKSQPWQTALSADSTARNGKASIGHFIRKAFLVSDNDAYNRLYQWVGQRDIHDRLRQLGYQETLIPRQFLGLNPEQGRHTNGVRFVDDAGNVLFEQAAAYNPEPLPLVQGPLLGKAHINREGQRIEAPFDFTGHNRVSLGDFADMLLSVMLPEAFEPERRFQLTEADYSFLRTWLSAYPSETDEPKYDTQKFYDSYVKFFFRDSSGIMPKQVRVFNKVGWAYGFLTDVSYVADFANGIEYLLAATVYVNSNETLNDGTYDYETIGWPFMYQLGQAIYQLELQRPRTYRPNLDHLKLSYEQRDPGNKRPAISEVDN